MRLLTAILDLFRPRPTLRPRRGLPKQADLSRSGALATVEVTLPPHGGLRVEYAPRRNGMADAGEIVWAWVPFQEDPTQGKDRPLLVIARQDSRRVLALKLTSRPRDRDSDHLAIGAGPWDASGRPSWIDIDQLYSVHQHGIRREAGALDHAVFVRVADVLQRRYGWERAY
ncbi:type II toxin-antitoxin system PemK/MazF family toxin [Microbacterium terricola]|uniref:mRNA interferase PemK n=1 Tax=Microbacterium terricola TaxID=344163 RepID=A0ABM8DYG2_9MICO|nr:type II toxin-antitoxin system PemK/MazF family toxin [Microbacterium terricola]UYK38683.1 type II toxin-antitoxin system PemK/MazF family toxin [Microbacterium terricola]BDV30629.1 mRNA interferase PemK [Microbacterium terricola]